MDWEFDVLGIIEKVMKYVVHLSKKMYLNSHKVSKQQRISFWSQGILGIKNQVTCY
jgi:hypothetical protein